MMNHQLIRVDKGATMNKDKQEAMLRIVGLCEGMKEQREFSDMTEYQRNNVLAIQGIAQFFIDENAPTWDETKAAVDAARCAGCEGC